MITESGTIKTNTPLSVEMQRELTKPSLILGIILVVSSGVLFCGELVLFIFEVLTDIEFKSVGIFMIAAVSLFAGLVSLRVRINLINQVKNFNRVIEAEFFSNYFVARVFTQGELTTFIKTYYGWTVNTKETLNYLFIYNASNSAIPVLKSAVTAEELVRIKELVNSKALPPVQPVQAENSVRCEEQTAQTQFKEQSDGN